MEYPKDVLNKIAKNKSREPNEILKERTTGTVTGSLIGGLVGLIYAFSSKKSYLVFGTLGVLAGGLISNIFISKEMSKPVKKQADV